MVERALSLKNISKTFGKGHTKVEALKKMDFSVAKGELVAVIGPSGSGKSTFLTIAAGLQKPSTGQVSIGSKSIDAYNSKELAKLRFQKIGFVLQSSNLVPFLTVADQFTLIEKVDKSKKKPAAREDILQALGIEELKQQYPRDLSGGEKQRVAIACALYHDPDIILADEPTASLDSERAFEVVKLLGREARNKNKGIVMVTHDERLLAYCDRTVKIRDGKLADFIPDSAEV